MGGSLKNLALRGRNQSRRSGDIPWKKHPPPLPGVGGHFWPWPQFKKPLFLVLNATKANLANSGDGDFSPISKKGRDYLLRMSGETRPWGKKEEGWQSMFRGDGGHSSSETNNSTGEKVRKPSAKAGEVLRLTVDDYARRNEARAVHFVTLTVPDGIKDERELSRRINSVRDALLERYHGGVRVYERHKSGAVHVHLVLVYKRGAGLRECRTMKIGRRTTLASPGTGWLELWAWWRALAARYNFGRVECLPVRKPERAGNYVSKYLTKGEHNWQKGTRLYAVWKLKVVTQRSFSFAGGRARLHRQFMRWLTDCGGTVEVEEKALARCKVLWGDSRWMRVIWWHVKEGWVDMLKAQWLGMVGVSSEDHERREYREGMKWWNSLDDKNIEN